MNRVNNQLVIAACLLVGTGLSARADEPNLAEAARRVAEGNRLLNEGKAAEALKEYDAALAANPEAPETAYNRGLALYKLKEYDAAGKAFQGAIRPDRPELEAKTKYNLGRSAHAAALAASEMPGEETDQLAIGELAKAIRYYDETLQLAPTDVDAKHNRELAERMIRYIERRVQQKKQEQQNKQPSSQPSSQPSDQNQEGDKNPSSQPSSQPTSQPDQQDPSSQPSSQPSDAQQGEDKDGDKDKNEQDSKEGEQDDKNQEKSDPRERRNAGEQKEMRKMSKEEAERYLQQARDAEAYRRKLRRQMEIQQRGRIPVEKDW